MTELQQSGEGAPATPALPIPRTSTDELLSAVHEVLVEIRDRLPARPTEPVADGRVDITESGSDPARPD